MVFRRAGKIKFKPDIGLNISLVTHHANAHIFQLREYPEQSMISFCILIFNIIINIHFHLLSKKAALLYLPYQLS